ncbi:MAG: DinB family protein [Gemmatimonas sp.]|jgi:uncharacterized damage-inducible protein DinB|uniref:DinB family protein n=1 Tax=Gemmatimonas sp. TaxID=1962908 RepID=UPI00391FC30E|nr:DinB family protein [Gemmatimonadota bacterium]
MSTMATTVLADLDHEMASTRLMLQRIPAAHLDFTPHAKSWTLRKLATHLLDFPLWGLVTLQTTTLDFAAPQPPKPSLETVEAFITLWDERVARFKAALDAASDADLTVNWTATVGEQVVMRMPRLAMLRGMVLNHMIHHRAQLSIYYRLLDVPLPGLYGPSADER